MKKNVKYESVATLLKNFNKFVITQCDPDLPIVVAAKPKKTKSIWSKSSTKKTAYHASWSLNKDTQELKSPCFSICIHLCL